MHITYIKTQGVDIMAKKHTEEILELCSDENIDDAFSEVSSIPGDKIASFSFAPPEENTIKTSIEPAKTNDNNTEDTTSKRSYMLKTSTIKKLNELKYIHPNLNVYISAIVTAAIDHYYNYIVNEGGKQE